MNSTKTRGHLAALLTILIWGTTFISTKILLQGLAPIEILFLRFLLGWLALGVIRPRRLRTTGVRQELWFAAAGLCGVTLYFLLENIALTYTLASNVGVLISTAPFFTALIDFFFCKGKRPSRRFFVGFAAAFTGVLLMGGGAQLGRAGDLLALLAAAVWAIYSLLTKKISTFGFHPIQTTRHTFFYGLLFMLPALPLFGFHPHWTLLTDPAYIGHLLFLGLGASALCFVTWSIAVARLGAVQTNVYIYLVPAITALASWIVLREQIGWTGAAGILLTTAGLALSQWKKENKGAKVRSDA